ncbi:MAG: endonuclease III [Patescibacteria group bacterium]|nr:MAG: endonuclease III [Patescibacteria group bacterium]
MPEAAAIRKVIETLRRHFPGKGAVELDRPEDVLLATVLSARTRDEQVLKVYPKLRKRFPTLASLKKASVSEIADAIKEIGLYRAKAKSVKGIAEALLDAHGGNVPDTMEALVALPGVGRKTANCVLCYAFKKPAIAVDTHVHRIANRLGWVRTPDPQKTEFALMRLIPKGLWLHVNRVFVQFGRAVCVPGRPRCWKCPVARLCRYPRKTITPS